jgi:hypothetical protein
MSDPEIFLSLLAPSARKKTNTADGLLHDLEQTLPMRFLL